MLWRKLWADTLALLRHSVSLILLVILGIFLYVGLYQAYQNLTIVYGRIYDSTHFADASVLFESGPASLVTKARTIPHVRQAIGRIVKDGAIIQRGRQRQRVLGRFVAVPPKQQPPINALWITDGRYLTGDGEAVLERQFAQENGYQLGDRIKCTYLNREKEFVLVGFATSPEYVYPVPDRHALFIARGTFGVLFIDQEQARDWFAVGRQINEIHCRVDPGHEAEVAAKLEGMTHSYGVDWAFAQDEQPSKRLLALDQQGFATLSVFFPVLFLIAAALSLYGALSRIVRLQVTVIGTLRACGFSRREIGLQYVLQGGLITVMGAIPGAILGHVLSIYLNRLYVNQLHLPLASAQPHWDTILMGLVLAALTGLAAAYLPARMAANLPPAIAMRGDTGSGTRLRAQQALVHWTRFFPVVYRIPVRGIFRRASRTIFAVAGIAGGVCILLTTFGQYVSTMDAIDEYLTGTRHYQIDLQFIDAHGGQVAEAAASLPGGRAAGLTASIPVRIRSATAERELVLTGLQRGQDLLRPRTIGQAPLRLRAGTVWIPHRIAEGLHVEPGDPVQLEWVRSGRRHRLRTTMRVAGLLDVAMGNSAYGDYRDVRRALVDEAWPQAAYGAHFDCDPTAAETFRRLFERSDEVALVTTTQDAKREIDQQMALMYIFLGVLLSFGTLLAGSAIHSVSAVSLLERTRELASLRSLGFSARGTGGLAGLELVALGVLGLIVGLPLGTKLNEWFAASYETENMAFRAFLPPWVHVTSMVIVFGLVAISTWLGTRRLRALDLAQATKARE
jgi:putative ABC transport system permease protein